jgi:serine/threonine protein kinase
MKNGKLICSGILREADARFYTAEMYMAIKELHRIGYIHRFVERVDKTKAHF